MIRMGFWSTATTPPVKSPKSKSLPTLNLNPNADHRSKYPVPGLGFRVKFRVDHNTLFP